MVSSISFRIPIYITSFFCLLYLFRHLIPYTTRNYYFHKSPYRNIFGSNKTGRKRTFVPSEITTNPIRALTFQYQNRLKALLWRETQCDFLKTCIQENQTVFPYLSIPPNPMEYDEQFNIVPLQSTIRIAVLHIWSSSESLPPPFYSYWLVSAMANSELIDFLIFVPDNTTQILLKQSIIQSNDVNRDNKGKGNNIHIHVVGDFKSYYTSRLGSILEDASYTFHPMTVSRLKPMLGYIFEDYLTNYSHWAWADMDIILGNLTKFLIRPLVEGYSVISISSVDYIHGTWASHLCSRFEVALAGQFTVFINTPESRNYFRYCDLKHDLRHRFDEGAFPKALRRLLGIQVAHVFAQVTDQFGFLNDTKLVWSPKGLVWYRSSLKCFDYEVAMVHVMKGKRLIRPPPRRSNSISVGAGSIRNGYQNDISQSRSSLSSNQSTMEDDNSNLPTMEQIIFPNLFKRGTSLQGFTLRFPVSVSRPWKMVSEPTLPWVSCT